MRRVFITGGFGFFGQYIVQAVHEHDPQAELLVLVRTPRRTFLPIQSLPRVRLISADLRRPDSFEMHLAGVDVVIHNAALVSFKKQDRQALYQSNITGTHNLLQAAIQQGCKNFIFISSISAVGRSPSGPADETILPNLEEKLAHDMYGYSKLVGEQDIQACTGKMRVIILNPSVIIGPGSRRITQLARWMRCVPVLPIMTSMNSFVDVRDAAQAVVLALHSGRSGERYIITAYNVDTLSFTRSAVRVLGSRTLVVPLPKRMIHLGDGLISLLDWLHLNPGVRKISDMNVDKTYAANKIRDEMGWCPAYSLEQSLADTFAALPRT